MKVLEGRHVGGKSTFKAIVTAKPKNYAGPQRFTMPQGDPYCKGCRYFAGNCCDYIGATGHPRILASPPPPGIPAGKLGKYCAVRDVKNKRASGPKPLTLKGSRKKKAEGDDNPSGTSAPAPFTREP